MLSSCKLQFLHPSSQSNVPAGPVQSSSGHVFSNVVAFPSITGEIDVLGKPAESTAGSCAESQPVRDMSDGVFRSVVNPSLVEDLIENFEVHLHLLRLFRKKPCQFALFVHQAHYNETEFALLQTASGVSAKIDGIIKPLVAPVVAPIGDVRELTHPFLSWHLSFDMRCIDAGCGYDCWWSSYGHHRESNSRHGNRNNHRVDCGRCAADGHQRSGMRILHWSLQRAWS